ncbi:hypothetical protein AB0C47_04035 [Micromonospora taraxaci]
MRVDYDDVETEDDLRLTYQGELQSRQRWAEDGTPIGSHVVQG